MCSPRHFNYKILKGKKGTSVCGFQVTCKDKRIQNTFILRQNISVPLSIRPLKFIDTPRLTYPGHDLSWHAVSRVSGTWHSPTRQVSRHVAFRSATRRVSREISRLQKFHEITHFTQCKGKNIFQLRKSLKVGWTTTLCHAQDCILFIIRQLLCLFGPGFASEINQGFCFLFSSFMFRLV